MKAALWYGKKDVRVMEIEEPKIRPGYAKIRVECCGICGTDLHEYLHGPIVIMNEPHPLTGEKAPIVIGHEFAGEVVEVGPEVTSVKLGDRVAVGSIIGCGKCKYCRQGDYRLCQLVGYNGLHGVTGGFAEYTVAPEYQLYKLPGNLSYEEGALCEPLSVSIHAMSRGEMLPGRKVGIFGAGPIGLGAIQAAKASGASLVISSELSPTRRENARRFGADLVIDPGKDGAAKAMIEATEGMGLDVAFECVGHQSSLQDAINATGRGATIVQVGVFVKPASVDFLQLLLGEKRIVFSNAFRDEFPVAMALMADGRINGKGMITKKISLDNLVSEGFEELVNNSDKHIKIMVYPS